MEKKEKGKWNKPEGLAEAFCEVMLDMDAKTLADTLTECGLSPKVLAEKSRSVAEEALERFGKDEAERVKDVGRVKALHEGADLHRPCELGRRETQRSSLFRLRDRARSRTQAQHHVPRNGHR